MAFWDFLNTYFLQPIKYEQGYNYVNTITYSLVAFTLLFFISKIFRKTETKIDTKFFFSLLPFIVIGSLTRALVDSGQLQRSFWVVSPGVYISIASLFFTSLIVANLFSKWIKIKAWKTTVGLGILMLLGLIFVSLPITFVNLVSASVMFLVFSLVTLLSYTLLSKLSWSWATSSLNFTAIAAQLFDATNTSFLIQFFGAVEKHPLPRAVMDFFGTAFVFYPLKLTVVLLAIYVITKDVKDKYLRNILILAIAILGLSQGLRNILGFVI